MSRVKDINERTLEEEKNDFVLVCKVFEALCAVMTAVFTLLVVIITGAAVVSGAELTDIMVLLVNSVILLFGIMSSLNFGRSIFSKLKSGETPFRYDIADKVKGASLALLICGFASVVIIGFSCVFSEAFSGICHYYFFVAVGNCFVGILLGIMSYVMSYGCKLQQESDETL